jgi:hypothetical protein
LIPLCLTWTAHSGIDGFLRHRLEPSHPSPQDPLSRESPADIRAVTGMAHGQCIRSVFRSLPEETLPLLIRETMEEDNAFFIQELVKGWRN